MKLRKRSEFLRVAGGGAKWVTQSCVVQAAPSLFPDDAPRFGFTVSKKNGNAVIRNRIRRRLRAAVGDIVSKETPAPLDYVIISRPTALHRPYDQLLRDLAFAFKKVPAQITKQETSCAPSS